MNTILRSGDKVRVVRDDISGLKPFSVVTLKEKLTASVWSIEELPPEHCLIEEDACGVACLRCQPGGSFEHPCTCRTLVCASCLNKERGFLAKCLKCTGTLYPEEELLKKLTGNHDAHLMKVQLESITIQLLELKKFFDKGDFLRVATRADELSGACSRLANMASPRLFPKS